MDRKMSNTLRLDILPSDVLLIIFDFCNEYDLLRLSEVCRRFYDIARSDAAWTTKRKKFLVTNQMSKRFRERCRTILPSCATWRISKNWYYGAYKQQTVCTRTTRLMPWLKMTTDILWWSGGNELVGFTREKMAKSLNNDFYHYPNYAEGDIRRFTLWKDYIICGYTTGIINYFLVRNRPKCQMVKKILNNRSSCINAIDATSNLVITGLDCGGIKVQRHPDMNTPDRIVYDESEICLCLKDKVRSLSVDPTGVRFAVGSSGIEVPPLHIIDIERYIAPETLQYSWRHGAGILDMVWDDPNTLLTCGYDTYIRKWDLRTRRCVSRWSDPTDATLYCISSDHRYSMVTGTQYNCLAVLWDQRKKDFVQLYYVNSRPSSQHSPIYSVQFDNAHLYCATDKHIIGLTFSDRSYRKLDYKSMYVSPHEVRKFNNNL